MNKSIRPLTTEEVLYTYHNSQQISSQTGLIGHLRADMGSLGTEFHYTWFEFRSDLNTSEFKSDLDAVIDSCREKGSFLSNRTSLAQFCLSKEVLPYDTGRDYGVRIDTDTYAYLMRLNPHKGDYNLYCHCYFKEWLDAHMQRAKNGICIKDSEYRERFRLADGDEFIIRNQDATGTDQVQKYVARYVNDSHFEFGRNLFHVDQFADFLERSGQTVVPLRASLPHKAYVYVESDNRIGVVTKGEMGYKPLDVRFRNKTEAVDYIDTNNRKLGISISQSEAMKCGSMFGWDVPLANPINYDERGNFINQIR